MDLGNVWGLVWIWDMGSLAMNKRLNDWWERGREREREGERDESLKDEMKEKKKEKGIQSSYVCFVLSILMILWVSKRKRKSEKLKIMKKEEIGNFFF